MVHSDKVITSNDGFTINATFSVRFPSCTPQPMAVVMDLQSPDQPPLVTLSSSPPPLLLGVEFPAFVVSCSNPSCLVEMGDYGWSLGTLLAGALLNTFFLGIVAQQYCQYYTSRANDSSWVRMTVHCLLAIDIVHSALIIYVIWFYIIENFENPANVLKPFWVHLITALMETFSAVLTQNFLAHRLFCLNRRRPTYTLLLTLTSLTLALGVLAFFKSFFNRANWNFVPENRYIYVPWMAVQVITDILISVSLTREFKSFRTGAPRSDRLLSILMSKAIQAGLFATIVITCAGCALILELRRAGPSHICGGIIMVAGRVYSHALLDTLLVRTNFREVFSEPENLTEIVARDLEILGYHPDKSDSSSSSQDSHATIV